MPSSTVRRKAPGSSTAARPSKRSKVAPSPSSEGSDVESNGNRSVGAGSASRSVDRSGSGSDDDNDDDDDDESEDEAASKAAMLRALEAHGRSMFGAVLPSAAEPARGSKGKGRAAPIDLSLELSDEDDAEDDDEGDESFDEDDSEGGMEDDEARFSGGDDGDDDLLMPVASSSSAPAARKPVEITFDPLQYKGSSKATKAEYKAFMNSKASKILADPHAIADETTVEASDEKLNLSLDKTLHSMLQPLLASDGKQTAHSLQGRLTELSGDSRLGKGEKSVRKSLVSSLGASRVGTGLRKVGAEKYKREVATARERGETEQMTAALSGSLYADEYGKKKNANGKGRKETDRGLKMGVGSFGGGTLKLSASDMEGVKREVDRKKRGAERFQREHGRGRGRGGGGGRGGGRGGGAGRGGGGGRGGGSSRGGSSRGGSSSRGRGK